MLSFEGFQEVETLGLLSNRAVTVVSMSGNLGGLKGLNGLYTAPTPPSPAAGSLVLQLAEYCVSLFVNIHSCSTIKGSRFRIDLHDLCHAADIVVIHATVRSVAADHKHKI